ncbi:Hypothetical protein D9617_15g043400 [Elsinoe fawcettii]|nr:Hypothetical protein D9617_15g043400 [Elsinoe fawcettii]
MPSIPRRARAAIVSVFILYVLWEFIQNTTSTARDIPSTVPWHEAQSSQHPFDRLISHAQDYQKALGLDTPSLSAASDAYRKRRGRHPPPGFDKWHTRAVAKEAFITESFFDQIYEDLEPFWGTNPTKIEEASRGWEWTIRVRSGKVIVPKGRFRAKVWGEMIRQLSSDLPDMNILINPLDEARVVMPYHAMEPLIAKASDQKQKMMSLPRDSISARKARPIVDGADSPSNILWTISGPYWSLLRQTCAPAVDGEVSTTATANQIGNWTAMKNICENRHWRNLHGGLIQPQTLSVTTSLVPIFSDAKLHGNNDILLPPPSYYTDDAMFSGSSWLGDGRDKISWHRKTHGLIWRGKATGGRSTKSTWQSFQRHRR